jgi:hypothetical protein
LEKLIDSTDDNFYDEIESLTGIDYKSKKEGRPRKSES